VLAICQGEANRPQAKCGQLKGCETAASKGSQTRKSTKATGVRATPRVCEEPCSRQARKMGEENGLSPLACRCLYSGGQAIFSAFARLDGRMGFTGRRMLERLVGVCCGFLSAFWLRLAALFCPSFRWISVRRFRSLEICKKSVLEN